jgi:hypothetical protein
MSDKYYDEKIQDLPPGLVRTVARILEKAQGHKKAIHLDRLVGLVNSYGTLKFDERQVRAAIEELRNGGMDIINLQDGAGYFIPSKEEKELYIRFRSSYTSRAKHIFETMHAMDATAIKKFGNLEENPQQPALL